jgi:hypothetical protein
MRPRTPPMGKFEYALLALAVCEQESHGAARLGSPKSSPYQEPRSYRFTDLLLCRAVLILQQDDGENSRPVRAQDQYALDIAYPARAGNQFDETWISVGLTGSYSRRICVRTFVVISSFVFAPNTRILYPSMISWCICCRLRCRLRVLS